MKTAFVLAIIILTYYAFVRTALFYYFVKDKNRRKTVRVFVFFGLLVGPVIFYVIKLPFIGSVGIGIFLGALYLVGRRFLLKPVGWHKEFNITGAILLTGIMTGLAAFFLVKNNIWHISGLILYLVSFGIGGFKFIRHD